MAASMGWRAIALRASLVALAMIGGGTSAARAQTPSYPPPPSTAAEVAHCLCLRQAVDVLGRDMAAKQAALEQIHQELGRIDAQLQSERARIDVNDTRSVARFRQLLDRRDALFRRSTGAVIADTRAAVERYNARVNEYNARCANRPTDPVLLSQVQATLTCPPLY